MNNKYIDLHLGSNSRYDRNEKFLIDLYFYIVKRKNCHYIELIFSNDTFETVDKVIFDKLFNYYTYEEEQLEGFLFFEDKVIRKIRVKANFDSLLAEDIKIIRNLDFEQMMLFPEPVATFEDRVDQSIVLGAYDIQTYLIISNINDDNILEIRGMLKKHYISEDLSANVINYRIDEYEY